jgi:O-antigen ligase
MNREDLDGWLERAIVMVVMAIVLLGPLWMGAARPLPFLIIQGLTVVALGLWFGRVWVQGRVRVLWPPVTWAVLAFAGYAVWRYTQADIEYVARQELIRVLVYASLFLVLVNNLHRQEPIQYLSYALIGLGMVLSFVALYQVTTGSHRVWDEVSLYVKRGTGTYMSPNHLAGYLEMVLPLSLAFLFVGRGKAVTRILIGYCALVMMAGLASTVSRGGWVSALVAVTVLFGFLIFHRKFRLPSLAFVAVLIGVVVVCFPRDRVTKFRLEHMLPQEQSAEKTVRLEIWETAINIWQDYPWWGAGPGHFDQRYWNYRPESLSGVAIYAHNDYLNTLADWGAAGGALVMSALALVAWGVWKTWRHVRISDADLGGKNGSNKFAVVFGASLGLLAIALHSMVDFNMQIPANAILAVVFMAFLASHCRFATEKHWHSLRIPGKLLLSVLLAGAMGYLGWQCAHLGRELHWLAKARHAEYATPEQIGFLERAFKVEPRNDNTAFRLGEVYRELAREGGESYPAFGNVDYRELTRRAMDWLMRSHRLNRWHGYTVLYYAACLDWLGQFEESARWFDLAEQLDPNGSDCMNLVGRHYLEKGDPAGARPWLERSLRLRRSDNPLATNYMRIANQELMRSATNIPSGGGRR